MASRQPTNETLKNLQIQAKACARLGKELQMYCEEKAELEQKLQEQREQHVDKHLIQKTQEFVSESAAVIEDTRARAEKYVRQVQALLDELDPSSALYNDPIAHEARRTVENVSNVISNPYPSTGSQSRSHSTPAHATAAPTATSHTHTHTSASEDADDDSKSQLRVAIYGSSRCNPGDPLYTLSEQLGEALGKAHYHVITGGYMGTMEGASKGAYSTGTVVEGIISPPTFPHRGAKGNEFLNMITPTPTLQDRITLFTKKAHAFIVLPGNTGTLAEFMFTWNVSVVKRFSNQQKLPIYVFRDPWEKALMALKPILGISDEDLSVLTFVDTVDEIMKHLATVSPTSLV